MNKKAAVIGFIIGIAGGAFLLAMPQIDMFGRVSNPFSAPVYQSPWVIGIAALSHTSPLRPLLVVLQLTCFWGVLGALATHAHISKARFAFAAMLIAHTFIASVLAGAPEHRAPYAAVMGVFLLIALISGNGKTADCGPGGPGG